MANRLTNLPNFVARCKLMEGRRPVEYQVETDPPPDEVNEEVVAHVRERSRKKAITKGEVEEMIRQKL